MEAPLVPPRGLSNDLLASYVLKRMYDDDMTIMGNGLLQPVYLFHGMFLAGGEVWSLSGSVAGFQDARVAARGARPAPLLHGRICWPSYVGGLAGDRKVQGQVCHIPAQRWRLLSKFF